MILLTDPYKSTLKSLALRLYATSQTSPVLKSIFPTKHMGDIASYISNKQVKMTKSV